MTQPSISPADVTSPRSKGTPTEHRLTWWSTFFHVLAILSVLVGVLGVFLAYTFNLGAISFVGIVAAVIVSCALLFSMSALLAGSADVVRLLKMRNNISFDGDLYV